MLHTNEFGPEYSPEEWNELQIEIEKSGGAILPDACLGTPVTFKATKGGKKTTTRTCFCENESLAVVTYEPAVPSKLAQQVRSRGGGFVTVCLVCDVVGNWPRFAHAMNEEAADD